MQVVVQSLLTNYSRKGSGRTILLLHGWGDSSIGLKPLIDILSEEYDVIAVDLPGFGGTQSPEIAWGLDEYASFTKAFINKLNLEVDTIVGHSNGGAIAIRALSQGLEAKRLVLLASSGIRGEYKGRVKALRMMTKLGKVMSSPLPKNTKAKLRSKVYSSVGSDMLVAEHLQDTFKRIVADDVREDARRITIPTILIYGDKDTSTPLDVANKISLAIKGSQLIVLPGAGHMLPTEETDVVANKILEFMK